MRSYFIIIVMLIATFIAWGPDKTSQAGEKGKSTAIAKPKGGYTVEEVYTKKDELKGKRVTVRGEVVKFNNNIMGKNWIHIQDGSGKDGTNDLTVTTAPDQGVNVGDKVLVTGTVTTNKDVGAGHKYLVILEEGTITIEK
ncbi:MAG TPA: hypothetical protein VI584_04225 [Nitrospiria bacterium]|nr:hypothetical protein [Nitrospiria bacterium]